MFGLARGRSKGNRLEQSSQRYMISVSQAVPTTSFSEQLEDYAGVRVSYTNTKGAAYGDAHVRAEAEVHRAHHAGYYCPHGLSGAGSLAMQQSTHAHNNMRVARPPDRRSRVESRFGSKRPTKYWGGGMGATRYL